MIILKKFITNYKGHHLMINFGMPDSDQERNEMFKFRYQIYSQHKYINENKYDSDLEKDEYDNDGNCTYFTIRHKEELIGTIRLIKRDILPTEKDFLFKEPREIAKIDRINRAELGRLIIIPPNREKRVFLPHNLAMLIMINILSEYGIKNGIMGGYSFVKNKLEKKMRRRKFPFHSIKNFKLTVSKSDVLYPYFFNKTDPVIPIYYLTKEFSDFTKNILSNRKMFEVKDDVIILKNNYYNKFLIFFNII